MRLALILAGIATLLGSCRMAAAPPSPFDAGAGGAPRGASERPGRDDGGRFYARDDGNREHELTLLKLAVQVRTRPGTVRSHLTMEVAAPKQVRAEAIIRLPVPSGAAVTGAVLWVNGRPMNGAFVERDRARQIYRSIVERRRDPALVTWDGPGWVSVSIFPLENGEARRFELEWVEPAAQERGFVVYRVPTLSDRGRVVGRAALEVNGRALPHGGRDVVPLSPVEARSTNVVAGRSPGDPFHRMLVRAEAAEVLPKVVVLAETSAAMTAADRVRQREAIAAVLDGLPAAAKVSLLAADWKTDTLVEDSARDEARRALTKLDAIVSAGGLHLERALRDGAACARKNGAGALLFVGRGVDAFAGDPLRQPLAELRAAGLRLSVVATEEVWAPLADAAALTEGEALKATELAVALPALASALAPRPARPALAARGIDQWRALPTITGQTVWVGRALESPAGADAEPPVAEADPSDLVPLWDRARLGSSERAGRSAVPDRAPATALTPLRALLVLETEQDYRRFGLAVPEPSATASGAVEDTPPEKRLGGAVGSAPSDVLGGLAGSLIGDAFGVGGLGPLGTGSRDSSTGEGTIGLGNLGTSGKGGPGGGGSAYGRLGGRRAKTPDVVPGSPSVRGALDNEIVRRIVRRHMNEVKYCYESSLTRRPGLSGRVQVQFSIGTSGAVLASVLQSSTLGDASVETCIVAAVRRWEFPKPLGGGIVMVTYPFQLVPGVGEGRAVVSAGPALEPDHSVRDALKVLGGPGTLAARVERIASLLGLDQTTEAESLAWMIDRRAAGTESITLVARLLVAAERPREAVRVLTERGGADPALAAAELRQIGARPDADEVLALSRRR